MEDSKISNTDLVTELNNIGFIDCLDKDTDSLKLVLSLRGKDLSSISDKKLSEHLLNLTRYHAYLTVHYNFRNIEYVTSKRKYDMELNKKIISVEGKGLTVKEKTSIAMEDPEVMVFYNDFVAKERLFLLLKNLPESLTELANAIKKEMSVRQINK